MVLPGVTDSDYLFPGAASGGRAMVNSGDFEKLGAGTFSGQTQRWLDRFNTRLGRRFLCLGRPSRGRAVN